MRSNRKILKILLLPSLETSRELTGFNRSSQLYLVNYVIKQLCVTSHNLAVNLLLENLTDTHELGKSTRIPLLKLYRPVEGNYSSFM